MIHAVLFYFALGTLLVLLLILAEFAIGQRSMRWLKRMPVFEDGTPPRVSIVIAARNEARNIEEALQSVLRQEYPNLEFIVVDDRSTDATGQILDRLAQQDARLRVVHITELPAGWLGKCHAQQTGAQAATGELLLFTDADVVMVPTVVGRAVRCLLDGELDHLAIAPHMNMKGTLLNMFGGAFILFFTMYAKPWKARDPKSNRFIGIGAFNLIRAATYRAIGGHERIRMRPDDDMKLGKVIKQAGYRQECVLGEGMIFVEWYASVCELIHGLEKNSFAGVDYNLAVVVGASVLQLAVFVWPVVALVATAGVTWWLNAGIIAVLAFLYADSAGFHGQTRWHWVGLPVTSVLFQYTIWRATVKTLWNDGINWRGTHYSLAELKANKV